MTARRHGDRWARVAFAVAVAVNLLTLYWPHPVSGTDLFPNVDKVVHVLIFAAVACTGVWARLPVRWLAVVLVAHAVSSELVQHWALPGRSGDPLDAVADSVGVGLGLLLGVATAPPGGSLRHDRTGRGDRADWPTAGRDAGAG
ncbi:MAG: VanZ family protein [Actinomycetes bacterium]